MGQNNNHKSNFHFLILGCNPLQSITAWSLERIDITRRWVSSLVMLCQASTATVFSSCLFLGHFPFSFVFSKWNACSIGFRSGDWLGHCITVHFFPFKNSLVAFAVCFGSLSICTVKRRPMSSEAFGWIWADNIAPKHFRIHPAAFVSSHIINKYKRTSSTGSHTCPRHDTTTTMLHWWGGMLRIMSSSFPSPYSSLPITLVQVDLGLICP